MNRKDPTDKEMISVIETGQENHDEGA